MFAIDCSPSMFQVVNDETPFNCALKCVSSLLQDKIISSESDSIGVIFFGVVSFSLSLMLFYDDLRFKKFKI